MKVAVFGLGYVGITAAACLLKEGHTVVGVDSNEEKAKIIESGRSPVHEPGVEALLVAGRADRRFSIASVAQQALPGADLVMVCVGTPSAADGSHNMSFIAEVSRQIASAISGPQYKERITVAYRSTMQPGSVEGLIKPIFRAVLGSRSDELAEIVYNPEFLRESQGISDYFDPPKIVIGTADGQPCERLQRLYKNIAAPVFVTGYREAEFTKFVDNSFHALKVAFANEIGRICLGMQVDPKKVHEIFVSDRKLNISHRYLRPGGAFGGSCLPKDVRALCHMSEEAGGGSPLIDSLLRSNEAHKRFLFDHCVRGIPEGGRVLMLGLAFKKETDDLRESPHVDLARRLIRRGFRLSIHDPSVRPEQLMGQNLGYTYSQLPNIGELLISKDGLERELFDLVIDTRGESDEFKLNTKRLVDVNSL